jgi:hypothetical protein
MGVDKRDFKQSCIKAVRKEQVSKRRATPILKRLRYTKSPDPLSSRNENLPSPRRLYFGKPLKNRIHFYNKVQVVYIPSRDHYPESMKTSIWSNMAEIQRNARRNTIEFAAEGWDWRRACEDEAMYLSPQGERIHPVHIRHYRS